ncbi:HAD-IIIC family phosphatase [Stackebrandtia nassauensis]|uniref:FkbH like protein n=1 Tax=Stackebrandtia nassauensis (strain DSM 44728 / CIP 108903 / NRRL B-16338 / NBRC 102104 / LLR-40K-21) TaxID=446470 RepID=D3PVB5_STANL|nr:FkbH-like protein [Stackebrandtia nassauensis]ADD41168.1 FkbH like protein [Stackebrandtia nassauensis DSM 44728]
MIKCVVWDLDRTLVDGVFLESDDLRPRDGVLAVLRTLHGRGIVNSIASRNPPGSASTVLDGLGLGVSFVYPQFGWGVKSDSIRRIADKLRIGLDTFAFVDDDPYERTEVAAALPEVLVLSPDDIAGALDWPEFSPATVTPEARRRAESYQEAQERERVSREFTGSKEAFQRYCRTEITIRPATTADVPRLAELSRRTSRFNSRTTALSETEFADRLNSSEHTVVCVNLRDRFGDDGIIGGVVVARGSAWEAELVMMSCRAMGRGVIEAVLSWLGGATRAADARFVWVPLRVNERNLPLRLALIAAGYRAEATREGDAIFTHEVSEADGELAAWVKVDTGT